MSKVISILVFILMIGLVIFIHEFGHFLLAKLNGVAVVEFAIGMGPNIVSRVKNGTRYSIKWIPFGGYCMMLGDQTFVADTSSAGESVDLDEEHAFLNKNVFRRISIIAAGPVFNFLLALLLAIVLTAMIGASTTKISAVSPDYPAAEAGLQGGDMITHINGKRMHLFKDISVYMAFHEGEPLTIRYERDGESYETLLTPRYSEEEDRYLIGIIASSREQKLSPLEVLKYGWHEFTYNTGIVIKSLGMLFTGKASINDLSGPVGMASFVNDIVEDVQEDTKNEKWYTTAYWILINMISFTCLISANLGIMNLVPIPAVDGGRLLFLFVEAIRGKPLSRKAEGIVTLTGVVLLLLLMIFVFFNDIRQYIIPRFR